MSVVSTVKDSIPSITLPSVEIPAVLEKPVYAVVGAGDLWVAKAKATTTSKLKAEVKELPATLKDLPTVVKEHATKAKASTYYADLAKRGEKVLTGLAKKKPATRKPAAKKVSAPKSTL
jgi:hypothetical protein